MKKKAKTKKAKMKIKREEKRKKREKREVEVKEVEVKEEVKEAEEIKKEKEEKEKEEIKKEKGTCLICQKETIGSPVKEDFVIRGIRNIKTSLKIARGTNLIICDEHLEEARKKRERFEKSLLTYGGIGAVIGIILVIASLFGGRDLISIFSSMLIAILLIIVLVIFSLAYYFPAIEERKK